MSDIKDFVIEDGVLKKYTGNGGDVVIPDGVKCIGSFSFNFCRGLTSVTIPAGVTSIEGSAFNACSNLINVIIPDGVTSIGDGAFFGCSSLTSVRIPEGVKNISNQAFEKCSSLVSVDIPESVTRIGYHTFDGCSNLTSITIPANLTNIVMNAFDNCNQLKTVRYTGTYDNWLSLNRSGWSDYPLKFGADLYIQGELLRNAVIPEGMGNIGEAYFKPDTPSGRTSIGRMVFQYCTSLSSITFPTGVFSIERDAFLGCKQLHKVSYSGSLMDWMSIDHTVWKDTPFRYGAELYLQEGLLGNVTIQDGTTDIAQEAFYGCTSLQSITLPESIKCIGKAAFWGCNHLKTVRFAGSLMNWLTMDHSAWLDTPVRYGADLVIQGEVLRTVIIPESVNTLGEKVFCKCNNLTITIPAHVVKIGAEAFGWCEKLHVVFEGFPKEFDVKWFGEGWLSDDRSQTCLLDFPEGSFCTNQKLSTDYCKIPINLSDRDIAFIILYQKTKTWQSYVKRKIGENEKTIFDHMLAQFIEDRKASAPIIAEYLTTYVRKLSTEQVKKAIDLLKERKYKELTSLMNNPEINMILSGESIEENPIETYVRECIEQKGLRPGSKEVVASGIRYADSELKCSIDAVAFIISEYIHVGELAKPKIALADVGIEIDPEKGIEYYRSADADRVAAALNPDDLSDLAYGLINNGKLKYRTYMPLWGRFARGRKITRETEDIYGMSDPRWRSPNIIEALLLNDSVDAMLFENRIGNIDAYAKLRGKSRFEQREALLNELVKQDVHYAGNDVLCPRKDVIELISAYEYMDKEAVEKADALAKKMNQDELSQLLTEITERSYYTLGRRAWVQYASEESIRTACEKHIHMSKGLAAPDELGRHFYQELMFRDSLAVMQVFDKYGDLDTYAQRRGMTAMEVRDSMMLPAFDFDADGVKRYDIGGNTIEVSIAPDLSFKLFDVNKQKDIRSFPKKSDDPAKAEACAKAFADFKKEVLAFAKARTELLHKMHMSGEYVRADLWRKVYVEHPVISKLARLVVWQDQARKTFMISDDGIIDSQSSAFAPQGKIRVAHVLDMDAADIAAWQRWLAKRGCVQLFEQVWEPAIYWRQNELPERYSGAVLTNEERNAVKKALKLRGVDMRAKEMDREYNHRLDKWEFSNQGTMLFGGCLQIDYTVDEATKAITFGKASSRVKPGSREMNATLLEMDKATLSAQITRDNDAALTDQALSVFTAAQIAGLLNLAIDRKATRCTARMLDYKNAHFPEFAGVNEFSLDW